jgi:hypothetical protein
VGTIIVQGVFNFLAEYAAARPAFPPVIIFSNQI